MQEVSELSKERSDPGNLAKLFKLHPEFAISGILEVSEGLDTVGNPLPKTLVSKLSQQSTYEQYNIERQQYKATRYNRRKS